MATGIGNLPYTMPPVSPFDVITSQAENERIANIKALADGTGIGDGAVTSDKIDFATLPRFAARPSSNQSIGSSLVNVNFGTELYDVGSNFSGSQFTAPVDGYYHFEVQLGNAEVGRLALCLIANNVNLYGPEQWTPAGASAGNNVSASYDVYLLSGQTARVQAVCDVNRNLIAARCRFSGELVALG